MAGRIGAPAKCEFSNVIHFLQAEGSSAAEIDRRMNRVYGENFMSILVLCMNGAENFKTGEPTFMTKTQVCRNRRSCSTSSRQLLEQFKWDVSDYPAYSPVIATSDFHLFLEVKNWLGGQSFQKNEELQSNVKAHLTSLVVTFFEEGIRNMVYRYDIGLNLHGDYVEKSSLFL
ncbi:hypothetical protein AVEN_216154-1 [Araneus ventricosus]|uniref:Uncharacterized protein n=1 Tax=Araneus ventricosus TaxID=182803 RepID=A0A4Y2I9P1_ARAVE|nr:hypothetical protein AVEN_216154-1 [Araneus ventricosus]